MKKEEFIELYHNLSVKELCERLNCSVTTIYSLLDRYKIPKKGNRYKDYTCLRKSRKPKINLE